ncbi:MAG TPA: hypothetical protein VIH99_10445 [Bdellovibrionota bacterium]|jgi:hypothetical protein
MHNRFWHGLFLVFALLLGSCTKEAARGPDGKPMLSSTSSPNRIIFETELSVPDAWKSKIKSTDLLIADLKTENGEVVFGQMSPVPVFPVRMVIQSSQLLVPVAENAHLQFSARIVRLGEESKPPKKGQLQALVGLNSEAPPVLENKAVTQKLMDKLLKNGQLQPLALELSIGSKIKAELTPAIM